MKFAIVIILLIAGFFLLNIGIDLFQESAEDIIVLGLEIKTNAEKGRTTGVICLVLGIAALFGSYFVWKRK